MDASNAVKTIDVAIIGNGPSGMCLSYMLSGWTPTYKPTDFHNEDDLLHIRLSNEEASNPITNMNLRELSDGLEGRSSNPVALLFDQLTHPYADSGIHKNSQIEWKMRSESAVSHVVIGREAPGGSWQMMQQDMKTLSRSNWIELPNMPYQDWLQEKSSPTGNAAISLSEERATIGHVQEYYKHYVKKQGLSDHFMSGCNVTSIERVCSGPNIINNDSGEVEQDSGPILWEIRGTKESCWHKRSEDFCIRATSVVLATGASDTPKRLQAPGESLGYIYHNVRLFNQSSIFMKSTDPVLVVGAGLSAADAIIAVHRKGLPVIHVFRETPCGNSQSSVMLKKLPKDVYPEYTQMYRLMCNEDQADWYVSYPNHQVSAFLTDKKVKIDNGKGSCEIHEISLAFIQIGSGPDLSYLPQRGTNLGIIPGLDIDPNHNPIEIDPFTYETVNESNMYAMGPLVGDNFVRFLKGGALAITQDVLAKKGLLTIV